MTERPEDDLSPSLGGDRATEPPPAEPPRQEAPAGDGAAEVPDLEALFAELGQGDLAEVLRRLGPLIGSAGAADAETLPEVEELLAGFEPFSQEVQTIMEETIRLVEERLPPTIAAFEGVFSALGQVFQPFFEEPGDPPDRPA